MDLELTGILEDREALIKLNTDASFPFPSLMEIYIEDPDLGTLGRTTSINSKNEHPKSRKG